METGRIKIMKDQPNNSYANWAPEIGSQTIHFLDNNVPEEAREQIKNSAISVLSKSIPPNIDEGSETGLIVGYVQSGKTMSFEAVTALARDNNYQLIIVIAGTTTSLLQQSTTRLKKDLGLGEGATARRWLCIKNPDSTGDSSGAIRDTLDEWRDPNAPDEFKKSILITVLKHHSRLDNLAKTLSSVDLENTSSLIIDDEADQASLNNDVSQGEESSTYNRILQLRSILPNHTYLQYTATPQAPLLINLADFLSPNFVEVLEPGSKYAGGRDFFNENDHLIRAIPVEEVPTNSNVLAEPPNTLLEALRVFIVGVAISIRSGGMSGNRSMLVHPSHRTAQHQEFHDWVIDIIREWKARLSLPDEDPDKQELIEEFGQSYEDLKSTITSDIPTFEEVLPIFPTAFRNTRIQERNTRSGPTPDIEWIDSYAWILIGGQAMDRGFTVEGLTVTYMPRGLGAGNADTVQQRARFFGYKKDYLGYCRVYLEQATIDAFKNYIDHEEDIRSQLKEVRDKNQSLNEWKRAFVLSNDMKPCRDSVLEFDYMRVNFYNFISHRVVLTSDDVLNHNRRVVDSFIDSLSFQPLDGHPERTDIQRHDVSKGVDLILALKTLLTDYKVNTPTDSNKNTALLLLLSKALESNPEEICSVYLMSPNARRKRRVDEHGAITNLYQGEFPVSPIEQRGTIYPGDSKIHDEDNVSIQVHNVDLTRDKEVIKENVPILAIRVPSRLYTSIVVQEEE